MNKRRIKFLSVVVILVLISIYFLDFELGIKDSAVNLEAALWIKNFLYVFVVSVGSRELDWYEDRNSICLGHQKTLYDPMLGAKGELVPVFLCRGVTLGVRMSLVDSFGL